MTNKTPEPNSNSWQASEAQEKLSQLKAFFEAGDFTKQPTVSSQKVESTHVPKQKPVATKSKIDPLPNTDATAIKTRKEIDPKVQEAYNWLCDTYPNCFRKEELKPLKRHIEKDIFAELPENLPFARNHIRKAIARYTSWYKYLHALSNDTHRYDLQGNAIEEVTPEHQQRAQLEYQNQLKRYQDRQKRMTIPKTKKHKQAV